MLHVTRALRSLVPHMPCVLCALEPHVSRPLNALVPRMPRAVRPLAPYVLYALHSIEPHVLRALRGLMPAFSRVSRAVYLMCLVRYMLLYITCSLYLVPYIFHVPVSSFLLLFSLA